MSQQTDSLWMILLRSDHTPWTLKHQEFYTWSVVAALVIALLATFLGWYNHKISKGGVLIMVLLAFGSFLVITLVAGLVWLLPDSLLWFLGAQNIAQLHPTGVSRLIELLYLGQYLVSWNLLLAFGFMISLLLLPLQSRLLASLRGEQSAPVQESTNGAAGVPSTASEQSKDGPSQRLSLLNKSGEDGK